MFNPDELVILYEVVSNAYLLSHRYRNNAVNGIMIKIEDLLHSQEVEKMNVREER